MANNSNALLTLELLTYYDEKLKAYVDQRFKFTKKATPNEGAAVTYLLQTNETTPKTIGEIDIPEDKFVRKVELFVCETDDDPQEGLVAGHSYFKFSFDVDGEDDETTLYVDMSTLNLDLQFVEKPDIDALFPELATTTITVKVKWEHGTNKESQPEEVTVKLNKTGEDDNPVETETLDADNSWTVTWSDKKGLIGDYTIEVDPVEDYTTTGTDSYKYDKATNTYIYTITNTYDED